MTTEYSGFSRLVHIIETLRAKDGCPWDRKQTTQSLKKYLQEEFQEILSAIDNDDRHNLCEELGDFLYIIIMLAEINKQEGHFTLADITTNISDKLTRRHPHVFLEKKYLDDSTLRKQWHKIKEQEKRDKK